MPIDEALHNKALAVVLYLKDQPLLTIQQISEMHSSIAILMMKRIDNLESDVKHLETEVKRLKNYGV